MKLPSQINQTLPYYWNTKTQSLAKFEISLTRGSFIKQQTSLHCWKGLTISASPLKSPKVNARRDYNSSSLSLFFLYRKRWKLSQRGTMAISNWFSTFGIRSIVHPVAHLFQGLSKVYSDEDYKNKIKTF